MSSGRIPIGRGMLRFWTARPFRASSSNFCRYIRRGSARRSTRPACDGESAVRRPLMEGLQSGVREVADAVDGARVLRRLDELAAIGAVPDNGITRIAFSPEERRAMDLIAG